MSAPFFESAVALACERCAKPVDVCVCSLATSLPCRHRVLILQHPQEQDVVLGSAPLLAASLPGAQIVVGLSWRSLAHALGEPAEARRWAVLYPASLARPLTDDEMRYPALVMHSHGRVIHRPEVAHLLGIVVLDGTWSQAKSLWWRNAWLLKLPRLLLAPTAPSIYGHLRKTPRRSYVSTLEAVALALDALGEPEATGASLRRTFRTLVQRVRDATRGTSA